MRITDAKVIVCSPGRNFVTLKITTEGLGVEIDEALLLPLPNSLIAERTYRLIANSTAPCIAGDKKTPGSG